MFNLLSTWQNLGVGILAFYDLKTKQNKKNEKCRKIGGVVLTRLECTWYEESTRLGTT